MRKARFFRFCKPNQTYPRPNRPRPTPTTQSFVLAFFAEWLSRLESDMIDRKRQHGKWRWGGRRRREIFPRGRRHLAINVLPTPQLRDTWQTRLSATSLPPHVPPPRGEQEVTLMSPDGTRVRGPFRIDTLLVGGDRRNEEK